MQDELCWQAVVNRDSGADGTFVFAVRSTGIYCRPSCPARRPGREQVSFYARPVAAEEAGYRPCRRCHPEQDADEFHMKRIQQACAYIETHLEESLTLETLGGQVGLSPYHLQRTFKKAMGITPRQYAEACRLRQLKTRLREGDAVTTAMYDAGYGSSSRLYERTPHQLGMTPTTYRKGGQGMHITYTLVDCSLGRLLVAATERGVCAVSLGNSDTELEKALLGEYPAAEIARDGASLESWVSALLDYLAGGEDQQKRRLDLPIDVQATAFQWRVWQELRTIPYGETRSYSTIAEGLGDVKKTRAVANACASNPVALIVPCHRVVRGNGDLGGYRWGIERKQHLLAQEQGVTALLADETSSHR